MHKRFWMRRERKIKLDLNNRRKLKGNSEYNNFKALIKPLKKNQAY